jgi:hypothetical protein
MKLISLLFIGCIPAALFGQEKLSQLTAPTSPAAGLLGMQPSAVLTPKSYQALETAIFSNFLDGSGKPTIPTDFSLEFTPYWTKNHGLSLEEYLFPKSQWDNLRRNSSFSLASTQNFLLGDSAASNAISWGYRNTFYFSNKNDREKLSLYKKNLNNMQLATADLVANAIVIANSTSVKNTKDFYEGLNPYIKSALVKGEFINTTSGSKSDSLTTLIINGFKKQLPEFDSANADNFIDALGLITDTVFAEALGLKDEPYDVMKTYIKNRNGLSIDVAYAGMINFPTNDFEYSIVPRQSFWVTPSYRFSNKANFLKVMGVFRYEWYSLDYYKHYFPNNKVYQSNIDYGIAISANFEKFSCQFEAVGRAAQSFIQAGTDVDGVTPLYKKESATDLQYLGTFNYSLTDQVVLSYTLGNRFDPILNPNNTLVSTLTLNFGVGGPTKESLDLSK